MAKLEIEGAINTRAQVEFEISRVQRALAVTENARLRRSSRMELLRRRCLWRGKLVGR